MWTVKREILGWAVVDDYGIRIARISGEHEAQAIIDAHNLSVDQNYLKERRDSVKSEFDRAVTGASELEEQLRRINDAIDEVKI